MMDGARSMMDGARSMIDGARSTIDGAHFPLIMHGTNKLPNLTLKKNTST